MLGRGIRRQWEGFGCGRNQRKQPGALNFATTSSPARLCSDWLALQYYFRPELITVSASGSPGQSFLFALLAPRRPAHPTQPLGAQADTGTNSQPPVCGLWPLLGRVPNGNAPGELRRMGPGG